MLNKTKLKLLFVSFVLLLSLTAVSANENNTFTDLQTAIDESGNEVNITVIMLITTLLTENMVMEL